MANRLHDRYELLEALPQGGGGQSWVARDTRTGRRVVLKELHREPQAPPLTDAQRCENGDLGRPSPGSAISPARATCSGEEKVSTACEALDRLARAEGLPP